jgi:putative ABC transport system permease protein
MSKKQVTSGTKAKKTIVNIIIHIFLAILSFIWVLAIFIYILTMQKKSIFGVLKAEGVSSGFIGWSVMVQVLLLSSGGLIVGLALALLTGSLLAGRVPFAVNALFFSGITMLFLGCAAFGGIASVRSVVKINPVEAIG